MKLEMNEEEIQKVLEEAKECHIEAEVCDVVDCIVYMANHINTAEFYHEFLQYMGPETKEETDHFLDCFIMSLIMTLLRNFQKRNNVPQA